MSHPIVDAVSVILVHEDSLFVIKRQNFLRAFPGYWAFPGGKVDEEDKEHVVLPELFSKHPHHLMNALIRETTEELGINLIELESQKEILSIDKLGLAITPDFNPHRYATYFFKVTLKSRPTMKVDSNEAAFADWMKGSDVIAAYSQGEVLAVPPVLKTYKMLGEDTSVAHIPELDFSYDEKTQVPMIESMAGVFQLMPLSNTLPPAKRTNCFVIGDEKQNKVVIDPSPKSLEEYEKLKSTLKPFHPSHILLTHHHKDHIEYSNVYAREFFLPMMMSQYSFDVIQKKNGAGFFEGIDVQIVKEGDIVTTWLGKKIQVYEVPGHDMGQIAVAPVTMEWFLAGDLFQGIGTVVVGGENADMGAYFKTLEKVIKLKPKVVYPSHGIALGGTHILEKTLKHRRHREEQVFELYQKGLSEEEILDKIYFDLHEKLRPYALANIQSHLKKLFTEERIK